MWFLNVLNTYKLESAMAALLLSWLSNGVFFVVFVSLLAHYYRIYQRSTKRKKTVIFWDYRAKKVCF